VTPTRARATKKAAPAAVAEFASGVTPLLLASIRFLHQIHSYSTIAAAVAQLQAEAAALTAAKKLEVKK